MYFCWHCSCCSGPTVRMQSVCLGRSREPNTATRPTTENERGSSVAWLGGMKTGSGVLRHRSGQKEAECRPRSFNCCQDSRHRTPDQLPGIGIGQDPGSTLDTASLLNYCIIPSVVLGSAAKQQQQVHQLTSTDDKS